MRILVLSDLWPPFPGGAERLIFNLSRCLAQRGHEMVAVTGYEAAQRFDGPPLIIREDIGVLEHRDDGGRIVAAILDDYDPDVILTHHFYASQFRPELAAVAAPIVQIVLSGPRMPEAALAVYISQWLVDRFGDQRPGDLTIPPPAFPDVVADTHGDAIGFIKPIEHKGVEFFYRIARAMPDRKFVVLRGEWQDIEIIEPIPNVEFLEPVDDMRDFWKLVRVVLVPSLSEDAGTVGQEAALNGVPCISSKAGGLPETNGGGILLDTTRVRSWVSRIRELDDARRYGRVVEAQRRYFDRLDFPGKLRVFAEAVEALG